MNKIAFKIILILSIIFVMVFSVSMGYSEQLFKEKSVNGNSQLIHVASIESISPNPATVGDKVTFTGNGTIIDGTIATYLWTLDGNNLSTEASFITSDIPVGTHTITFKVQDTDGAWSEEVTQELNVIESAMEVPSQVSVILTFDDGWKTDYDVVYPLLKERNIRSTHYIVASVVGEDATRMSWQEIEEMYAAGFDMQCHSNTHAFLTDPSTNVSEEMLKVNEAFVAHGMPAPRHTAYPYGDYDENVISIVKQYRDSARVVSWENNASYPVGSLKKPYGLPSYPTEFNNTIGEIDKAIAGNYTLILCIHRVTDTPGEYNMPISEFVSILDHIESNDIPTQTISEYYNKSLESPKNVAPVTSIESIGPNPANQGGLVYFNGIANDNGGEITTYLWTLDGNNLSTEASFITSTSDIPIGTHTITFKAQDADGLWSEKVTETLTITEPEPPMEVPSGVSVILTFDDARKSDYDVVYPQLKALNIRSTHYIIASVVGEDATRMSWQEIEEMYAAGFDMQCHSNTHASLTDPSTNVSEEMLKVNEAFVSHGMPAPRHTAYPHGDYDENVISIVKQYRDSARVVSWENNASYPVGSLKKPYELPSYPTEFNNSIGVIDKAIAGNYTLILGFNQVTENPGPYDVSISEFVSILNHIKSNNIPTQTISEHYEENF